MVDVRAASEVQGETDTDDEEPTVTKPLSPLAALRGKRAEMNRKLHLDLPIPRWEEILDNGCRVWVRYGPGDPGVLQTAVEKRERRHADALAKGGPGDPQRALKANADFLVAACQAIFMLPLDEEPPEELPADLPTFSSPEWSETVDAGLNAVDTAIKSYATEGDLMVAAAQLLEWSGKAVPKAERDFSKG